MKSVVFLLVFISFFSVYAQTDTIGSMISKYSKIYESNNGILSLRTVKAVSKDPETGKELKRFEVTIERHDYFYKTPEIKALKYVENGVETETKKYDTREIEPFFPLFDKKAKENYKFEYAGKETAEGRNCLKINVIPQENTARHFKGVIFIDPEKLELVKLKGTLAKPHWAMKQYDFEFIYTNLGGFPVLKKGKVTARVKVFMIISDNITDYEITPVSNKFF
ncbi:MAG TPA: hypothetical protein PKG52_01325 [bacterium]|nr:hypothetical protein [bacterium]HPS29215.1 hypothetical protein [bacterium]